MTVLRLGHIGLTCSDLARSRAFYEKLFGFEEFFSIRRTTPWLAAQVGYPDADVEFCHLKGAGGLHLELLKYHHPHSTNPIPDDTYRPGNVHFNLWVDDIENLTNRIQAYILTMPEPGLARFAPGPLDIEASTITDGPQKGGKGYYMRDPDGHTIELWQPAPAADAQWFGR
jgi:catechol 2,3-dioxygenase-like lactoylglutathione lyase family enzyme